MNSEKPVNESIFSVVLAFLSFVLSGLAIFEVSQLTTENDIWLMVIIALAVVSCISIMFKRFEIPLCAVLVLFGIFLYFKVSDQEMPPPTTPVTENDTPRDTTPPVITYPVQTIPDRETESKIEIDFYIYCDDNNGATAQLKISGETAGKKPKWSSSNPDIVDVSSKGKISAIASGDATIYAEIQYDGRTYYDEIGISVDESAVDQTVYTIRYVESIPSGIDQGDWSYKNMISSYDINDNEQDGLKSINQDYYSLNGAAMNIGYIYYHWCRGEYDIPQLEIVESHINEGYPYYYNHNRASDKVETNKFHSFSCFFSVNTPSVECKDGSGCYWYEYPGVCNDSFWFWVIPVYEAEYIGYNTELSITIRD